MPCNFQNDCPETVTISDLAIGNYAIVVHSYTDDAGTKVCNTWEYITISPPSIQSACTNITLEKVGESLVINSPETHLMIVDIFDSNHQLIYHCNVDCKRIEDIDLTPDTYIVKIKVYDNNCQLECFDQHVIEYDENGLRAGQRNAQKEFVLTGSLQQAIVDLQWAHISMHSKRHFEIERSTDGINFQKIFQIQLLV